MTMHVEIDLVDPLLCEGCPFSNDNPKCKKGFERQFARLVDCVVDHTKEGPYSMMPRGMVPDEIKNCSHKKWSAMRPQACILLYDKHANVKGSLADSHVENPGDEKKNDNP